MFRHGRTGLWDMLCLALWKWTNVKTFYGVAAQTTTGAPLSESQITGSLLARVGDVYHRSKVIILSGISNRIPRRQKIRRHCQI
jgi:hypothetical protein